MKYRKFIDFSEMGYVHGNTPKYPVCGTPDYFAENPSTKEVPIKISGPKQKHEPIDKIFRAKALVFDWRSVNPSNTYGNKEARNICTMLRYNPTFTREQKLEKLAMLGFMRMQYNKPYSWKRGAKHRANGPCFVCGGKAYYQHHIFLLKNNGVNKRWNLIDICHNCHAEIHVWMTPKPTPEISAMDEAYRATLK